MKALEKIRHLDSIKARLITTFAILIIVPIIILGSYSYIVARGNLIQQTKIAMMGNSEVIAYGIENNVKRENDVVKFFSYEDALRRTLERVKVDPYSLTEELNNNIEPLIWYYLSSDTNIESITFYSDLLEVPHMGDFLMIPVTEKEKAWYEFTGQEYGITWMVDEAGDVYAIKALLDAGTSSKRIGMITLKVKSSAFFSIANQTSYLNNGLIIVNENGEIVTQRHIKDTGIEEEILERIKSGEGSDFEEHGDYFISRSGHIANGWLLYYYIDRSEITADVFRILLSVLVIAGVLFLLALVIGTFYAEKLSKRIARINEMANEIKNGYFGVEDLDNSSDEIGELSTSMKEMADTLNDMVLEIDRMNKEQLQLKDNDIHYREWLFDFVVEKNNDILAVVNEGSFEASFITANAEAVLGIPISKLKQDVRILASAQRDGNDRRLDEIIETAMATGDAQFIDELRLKNVKTNEHLYYRGAVVCTIDDGGKRMALAFYDRTQEIRRNHTLQEALNAAETANKAKTSFLANMSHDFRTPMNAITGFNLLIDKHADEPEKVREYTHKIGLASHNLLALLNDVLDMSKIESGKTTLDIKEMAMGLLLEEINSVISFQAKAKNQEYIIRADTLVHDLFMGDKQRINEILMNILGNAVKYTPEGGRIEFSIDESETSSEGFNNLRFTIKDNGIGMKPEYKDKIFDAFSREEKGATKTIQGTGLGMAITKSLVELMGGTIRVDSEEGKGSTFTVNLRLQVVKEEDLDIWKAHGIRSFLGINKSAEENVLFQKKMDESGLEGTTVTSGIEALSAIDAWSLNDKIYDFIIIDESIDDMATAQLVKEIRSKDKNHNSIVTVAASNAEKMEEELKDTGVSGIMQKPVLEYTIKQLLNELTSREEKKEETVQNPLEGLKFLAAEDNDINADILIELMNMEGATVTRGCNGQEVVEMFKAANEGDYDMILMDIQMPVMNGYEAAAAIRALDSEWAQRIPIIAMTANAYADDVQQAFDAGMNAHVTKPIDIKVMEKTILEFK
ncbi:ATP-binding protein [Butyrivibrio sp. FCS014]|uniref:ATP-binding protein n=1 Tax=Butyrivibrio sp. FCS014 TaxID=1408304 RepID=UPI000464CF3E|nr:ATP-binding protein [Butyrivibrio sp. FCS014]